MRLLAIFLSLIATVWAAEDQSRLIPAFNFDRPLPRTEVQKVEAQAAADMLLIWANQNRMRALGVSVKLKADQAKMAELKRCKGLPKSEAEFNKRIMDSLVIEIARCGTSVKEDETLAPAQRAQAEKVLTWAEILHDPIMPYTLPARCHMDPKSLNEKVRSLDSDRDFHPNPKQDAVAQARACLASADEDERTLIVLSTELFGLSCNPGNGISPPPDFGPAWRTGTPECAAREARFDALTKRCNYLVWIAEEKRQQAKTLANVVMADNHP